MRGRDGEMIREVPNYLLYVVVDDACPEWSVL
jgi:hypothetical protein